MLPVGCHIINCNSNFVNGEMTQTVRPPRPAKTNKGRTWVGPFKFSKTMLGEML